MKYAYFSGCSLHSTAKDYDESIRAVCKLLGIELVDFDWNCCGVEVLHSYDFLLSLSLRARNFALAEELGLDILTACSGCYHYMKKAEILLLESNQLRNKVSNILKKAGLSYRGDVRVRHLLDVIVKGIKAENLKKLIKKPLTHLNVVAYYGCLDIKPREISFEEDPEDPTFLEDIIKLTGAKIVPFSDLKTECCGGPLLLTNEEIPMKLSKDILMRAKGRGANCIVTACPFCHLTLELKQEEISKLHKEHIEVPVLYFTQLLGLAMGLNADELGMKRRIIPFHEKI